MTSTPYPPLVRRATPEDIDPLLIFVPQVLTESTLLPISLEKIEKLIERCAHQRGGAVAGIIDGPDGGIDASLGLAFCESETSDVPYIRAVWMGLHPTVRKLPNDPGDPRAHSGRTLIEFAKWCHEGLERAAGHPILIQFDLATRTMLTAKMRLFARNLQQVGASYGFGAAGTFVEQKPEEAEAS